MRKPSSPRGSDGFLLSGPVAAPSPARLVLAAAVFAAIYAVLVPGVFLVVASVLAWELLRWLLASVLLVPLLTALGLIGLLKGMLPVGLLVGAIAARTPERVWPKLLAASLLPVVDLLLLRQAMVPRLTERLMLAVMDHRALFALDTVAPLVASGLAAVMVPRRLVRWVLG
jgi:hypothetical protein